MSRPSSSLRDESWGPEWGSKLPGVTQQAEQSWNSRLQPSVSQVCPDNTKDRGAWRAAVHGVTEQLT